MEVSLVKGIYSRSGPIDKKISGQVNQVLTMNKSIYAGTSSGIFVKIDKNTLTIQG